MPYQAHAQTFIHPGGLHAQADLDRMKTQVAAGAHPWIDAWNVLITDWKAQNTYVAHPQTDFGINRQQNATDAQAAYENTLRWYISGDTSYAACAVRILNAWSSTVLFYTPSDPLGILPINDFAQVGEILRTYPGWAPADFARFQTLMGNHYQWCYNWLSTHGGNCSNTVPTSWEGTFVSAIMSIGVLTDNRTAYNYAVNYFKTGDASGQGNGCIMNAVYALQSGNLGQTSESGRDQSHSQLGMANLASVCQIAWNQGDDLYGYSNNRLLAGFEYEARYNLGHSVPYTPYNNCIGDNEFYIAPSQRGHNAWPNYEMVYNHYAILKGLSAPNTQAMAEVMRPELGSGDLFGQGTLTYTLSASAYPPEPVPATPTGLTATAGVSLVTLDWALPATDAVQGFNILRSTTSGGPYTNIASWTTGSVPGYTDGSVTNGTTYYYVISAINQAGTSGNSSQVSAKPIAAGPSLPTGWVTKDIGSATAADSATYANVSNNTFILTGSGSGIDGTADGIRYTYGSATGDATITARLLSGSYGIRTGVMIRESLDSASRALAITMGNPNPRYAGFGTRSTAGAGMSWIGANAFSATPVWFRLQRSGNTFTAYESGDGTTWLSVGSVTVTMNSSYYVGIFVGAGNSSFDNVTVTGGTTTTPSAPQRLTGTALTSSRISLSWPASSGASGYSVRRSLTSGGPYTTIAAAVADTSYVDSGLVASTTYYYSVKAANFMGVSADSVQTSVQTKALSLPPSPVGLKITAGNVRIALSWTATEEATSSYKVKRATVSGGPYTTIATPATTSYTDTTAVDGTTYYYVVSAVNKLGEGANSAEISAMPLIGQYSYWPFDETSGTTGTDSWNARIATLSSGAIWTSGHFNNGLHLDGTANGYATLPAGVVSTLTDFTVSTWVKLDSVASWARIFDFGSGTSTYMNLMPKNGNTGYLRYAITTGGSGGEQQINSTTALTAGTWTHVAVTLSGTLGILYVNGIEVGRDSTMTLNPSSLGSTTQNYIGKSQFSDPNLKGTLDEFRIYKQALTPKQIASLYTIGNQTLTFNALPQKQVGNADFDPGATSSSGLSVNYTSSDTTVVKIVTGKIHIVGPGTSTITALQAGNESYVAASMSQTLTVIGVPPVPVITIIPGDAWVAISWASTATATGYNVKRSTVSGGSYTTLKSVTATSYTDSTAVNGTTYYYVVSAVNTVGESANSTEISEIPLTGKYSYWPFDETGGATATDVWNGHIGTLNTGATWTAGHLNNGLHLDGTANGYATLPTGIVSTLNDFTVSAWVKLDSNATNARIFDFGSGTSTYMFLTPKNGSGYLRFAITTGGPGHEQQINSTTALTTGSWTNIAVTQSGGVGILYVNGTEVGRNSGMTLTPSSLGSTSQNYIGKSQWAADPDLKGTLDEFRIYSRALTAAEIVKLADTSGGAPIVTALPQKPAVGASAGLEVTNTVSNKVIIYPNPFENELNLNIGGNSINKATVRIYTTLGQLLYVKQYLNQSGTITVDLSSLRNGLYILKLSLDNSETTYKIMKKENQVR